MQTEIEQLNKSHDSLQSEHDDTLQALKEAKAKLETNLTPEVKDKAN